MKFPTFLVHEKPHSIFHYLIRASMVLVNFFGNNIRDAPGGFVLILNIFCEISKLAAHDSCEFAGALTQKCVPAICHVY